MFGRERIVWLIAFLVLSQLTVGAQEGLSPDSIDFEKIRVLETMIINGKREPYYIMDDIYIFPERKFKNNRQKRVYGRLVYNVKKVYPYAILAKQKVDELEYRLDRLESETERKKLIDQVEKDLFGEFEDDIRKMTITQGKILIKLIDRETGDTSYDLLKDFKGSFTAFFWQSVARIFGTNLKSRYDRFGEDRMIEEIVLMIEYGII